MASKVEKWIIEKQNPDDEDEWGDSIYDLI